MNDCIMRGDIFCANLNNGIGAEQRGYRPVLIIQNNTGNKFSPTVIVGNRKQCCHFLLISLKRILA